MKPHNLSRGFLVGMLSMVGAAFGWPTITAGEAARVFPTPEAAVQALGQAVAGTDRAELTSLFGDAAQQLVNPDEVQGDRELAEFAAAFAESHRLVQESEDIVSLEVGTSGWPFPVPLRKLPEGWQFDTHAGLEELLNRRIGRNELDVTRVLRAYVQSQREYAERDRDADEVLEYAQRLLSSPGRADGLYWPPELNGEISPLGPLAAYAQAEGYRRKDRNPGAGPQPFHGYLFKIVTRQGKDAPGGKYDYIINGNMIGGFALVAWPAAYGESGIMTFMVNQQGRIHQRDLGPRTAQKAPRMKAYNPETGWAASQD